MIYLDNSATTYPKPEIVYREADHLNRVLAFNAGRGSYKSSLKAQEMIDSARAAIAALAGSPLAQVYFSSSATLALNQIILGLCLKEGDHVYISPFEHNSIIRPLSQLSQIELHTIPFDKDTWELDEAELIRSFKRFPPKAVLISEVSNVTGFRLPWEQIFKLSDPFKPIKVLDASQSFGQTKSDYQDVDFLVFNGHKSLYGIMGAAGWINFSNSDLAPILSGGTGTDSLSHQMPESGPARYEAGTLNLPAIGVLPTAINWLKTSDNTQKEQLTTYLINELEKIDGVKLYLPQDKQSEGIVSFNLEGYNSSELAEILDGDFDICVRGGYHCSPLVHSFIGSMPFKGTVRASLGMFTTTNDIDQLISAIQTLSEEMK